MSKKEIIYEQPSDYAVTYADDIIFQLGQYVSKLIFYQNITTTSSDSSELEKDKIVKRMKFEVRIPQITLEQLAKKSFLLIHTRNNSIKAVSTQKDKKTSKAWFEFDEALATKYYDTADHDISQKELLDLMDHAENFTARLDSNSNDEKDDNR